MEEQVFKVSVVIPLYNKQDTIQRALCSVIHQSYMADEVIVVNDGSVDGSGPKVLDLIKRYPNITLIEQKNSGVSAARNRGVSRARNDFVCFLDADDCWYPEFLETMKRLVADWPTADLYCLGHEVLKGGRSQPLPKVPIRFRGYVKNFFRASQRGDIANSSKVCVRKSALEKVGGFPKGVAAGEDLQVWIRLALQGKVAFDWKTCCRIYQVDDESRHGRADSIPFPVIFFAERKEKAKLNFHGRNFIAMIALKHILASLLARNYKLSYQRWRAFRRFCLLRSVLPFYVVYWFVK